MSIFDKRVSFKPFEYEMAIRFKEAIQQSAWWVTEFEFTSDIQDYHVKLNDKEKNVLKRAMLAISQIEVAVKRFWGKLGDVFPKSEFDQVGAVFAESEVRHADAYSELIELLGLNDEFKKILDVPCIQGRVEYLTKYISKNSSNNKEYTLKLALFAIFIENVSLFSQFLIIKSFNKFKPGLMKNIDNVVQATQKEEAIHALFGVYLINEIKKEFPDWFDEEFAETIRKSCLKSYEAESKIIDWIFEQGDLDFIDAETAKGYIKHRFNESMELIGYNPVFEVSEEVLDKTNWFFEEIYASTRVDFFYKRPVTYSKNITPCTPEVLFGGDFVYDEELYGPCTYEINTGEDYFVPR